MAPMPPRRSLPAGAPEDAASSSEPTPEEMAAARQAAEAIMAGPEPAVGPDGVVDFSEDNEPIPFRVGRDTFYAAGQIPAGVLQRMTGLAETSAREDVLGAVGDFMGDILVGEGAADHFVARLTDKENPISMRQVLNITRWLVKQYAGVGTAADPTVAASPSSPGPVPTGLSSMAGQPPGESIPGGFWQAGT